MNYCVFFQSPLGPLKICADEMGITSLVWAEKTSDPNHLDHPELQKAVQQLDEYFLGTRTTFDLKLSLKGTDFQTKAWSLLPQIPCGQTISYAEQAARLGKPKATRAIGAANGKNPIPIIIPCHRVVNKNGKLGGFSALISHKRWLLNWEQQSVHK